MMGMLGSTMRRVAVPAGPTAFVAASHVLDAATQPHLTDRRTWEQPTIVRRRVDYESCWTWTRRSRKAQVQSVRRQVDDIWRRYGVVIEWNQVAAVDFRFLHVIVEPNSTHDATCARSLVAAPVVSFQTPVQPLGVIRM